MRNVYVCPTTGCDFARRALDETELERQVARHEATAQRRRFDLAQFGEMVERTDSTEGVAER